MKRFLPVRISFLRLGMMSAGGLLLLLPAQGQAQIWRCTNPQGVIEYSNSKPGADRRDCRRVELPSLTTIPAPEPAPRATRDRKASAQDFPRVDSSTQQVRDDGRRAILERELSREKDRLAALRAEYKDGEPDRLGNERNYQKYLDRVESLKVRLADSEANLAALQRELGTLR